MARHPLDTAFAKIERAKIHIKNLNAEVRAFLASSPYRFTSKINERGTEEVWSIAVDPVPSHVECIAADAVHNLRTPLDKMIAAGFRNGKIHQPRAKLGELKFPFADRLSALQAPITRLEAQLTPAAIKFICATQPFDGGAGHTIWAVNALDNRDKHRSLLEPIKPAFSVLQARQFIGHEGWLLRMGSARGRHMIPVPEARPGAWDLHQPIEALAPILRISPATLADYYLEYTSAHDDMEVFTTTPGAKFDANLKPALNLGFGDITGFEGEPVVRALESMCSAVENILDEFSRTFF